MINLSFLCGFIPIAEKVNSRLHCNINATIVQLCSFRVGAKTLNYIIFETWYFNDLNSANKPFIQTYYKITAKLKHIMNSFNPTPNPLTACIMFIHQSIPFLYIVQNLIIP